MSEPTVGDQITQDVVWGIVYEGREMTDIGNNPTEVQSALLGRMNCDWDRAYDLGFRLCQVRPTYRILSVLVERPQTTKPK